MDIRGVRVLKLFRINAIVLWPFTLYADRKVDPVIANHERIHRDQIRRDGVVTFYARYLKEYFFLRARGVSHDKAYRSISYEAEAFEHQNDDGYTIS